MKSLDLFSGAGGLALGTAKAGFQHTAVIDFDRDSCETIRLNQRRGVKPPTEWNVINANIRDFDFSIFGDNVDFLAGGVPCQPFSLGGKHRGHEDERDMFPYFIRAVQILRPKAFLIWAIADDHDLFSLDEMVAAFDVVDVDSNPARFDQKKADALNAEHIRMLDADDFTARLRDYFDAHGHHVELDVPDFEAGFAAAARLVQTRIVVLGDAWDLLKFLNDDEYAIDPKAAAKELGPEGTAVLDAALAALNDVADWTVDRIEAALKAALIEDMALKPRKAFGPIRVAATGTTVSPPLFESLGVTLVATAACSGCALRARRSPERRRPRVRIAGRVFW